MGQTSREIGRQAGRKARWSLSATSKSGLPVCRYASPLLPTLLPRPQVQMSVNGSRWGKKRRQRQTGEKHKATRLPTVRPWQFKELFNYVQLPSLNHSDKEPKTLFTFCAPNNQYPFVPLLCDMDKPSHHLMTFKRLYFFSVFYVSKFWKPHLEQTGVVSVLRLPSNWILMIMPLHDSHDRVMGKYSGHKLAQ